MKSNPSIIQTVLRFLGAAVGLFLIVSTSYSYIFGIKNFLHSITGIIIGSYFIFYGITGNSSIYGPFKKPSQQSGESNAMESEKSPADAMRELRLHALLAPAKDFGIYPTKEFPRVYAVLIDFPINDFTATIVSLSDGNASLYTTSTFGVIGGGAHDAVRSAAAHLIGASNTFFDEAAVTEEFPYPEQGNVRFYLVSFHGVRFLEASLSAIESDQSQYSSLFWLGQEVLTQLRLATEKR